VIPKGLFELLREKDPQRAERAVQAMLKMKKLDIDELQRAAG
jgi:predicted 3-demethylubiquinone-9 3-methyltransferase (glyoxalase superfamily)